MVTQTISQSKTAASQALSLPNILLRLEGLTVFICAVLLYANQGYSGAAFLLLVLLPDLGMIGYLVSPRVGSLTYNAVHIYTLPALLVGIGLAAGAPLAVQVGLIWFAHIGVDRLVGYGLKYPTEFKDTHLGRI